MFLNAFVRFVLYFLVSSFVYGVSLPHGFLILIHLGLNQSNADGQAMLASTLIPQPQSLTHSPPEEDVHMSFGRFFHLLSQLELEQLCD